MAKIFAAIAVASSLLLSSIAAASPLEATVYPIPSFRVSSPFGERIHPLKGVKHTHSGVDIPAPVGTKVRATRAGKVVFAACIGGYGRIVTIDHGAGISSLYGHLSNVAVVSGKDVVAGELIGEVGRTGQTTGAHLHFEVRIGGIPADPEKVLFN